MSLMYSSTMANPTRKRTRPSAAESARVLVGSGQEGPEAARHHHEEVDRERASRSSWRRAARPAAVLLYLAIAHAAEVEWTIDDFERMSGKKVPVICDLKAVGATCVTGATDLHKAGGIPQVLRILLDAGLLHGDCIRSRAARSRKN